MFLVCVVAGMLFVPSIVQACAICLAGAVPGDPMAQAFNWSVFFLMAMPYAVVGSVALWLFCAYRRAAGRRRRQEGEVPFLRLVWTDKESGR